MRVERSSTIAGQPIKKVRDFFHRRCNIEGECNPGAITEWFGADISEALIGEGLIERAINYAGREYFKMTAAATQLANARLLPRIDRAKAERIVDEFIERIEAINADPNVVSRVTAVDAFGSYITDAPDLGDIDLFVTWETKDPPDGPDLIQWHLAVADRSGRSLSTYSERLNFAEREARRRARGGNPYLSLHRKDEQGRLQTETRRIWPRNPAEESNAIARKAKRIAADR
jgi:hypothetical protein